jgi:hypothetical protein
MISIDAIEKQLAELIQNLSEEMMGKLMKSKNPNEMENLRH